MDFRDLADKTPYQKLETLAYEKNIPKYTYKIKYQAILTFNGKEFIGESMDSKDEAIENAELKCLAELKIV